MAFHYRAFGLTFRSEFELPGLANHSPIEPDVSISCGDVLEPSAPHSGDWHRLSPDDSTLVKAGVAAFRIHGGCAIVVRPLSDDPSSIASYTLGPALGLLLQQRGMYCLHASCVILPNAPVPTAVAFAGDSGSGKSTLARHLVDTGAKLVADDLAAITLENGTAIVQPGTQSTRMTTADASRYGLDPTSLPQTGAPKDKVIATLDQESCVTEPVPIRRVFALTAGDRAKVEELAGPAAAITLLRFCYFPELLSSAEGPRSLMARCTELAKSMQVSRLIRVDDITQLPELAAMI